MDSIGAFKRNVLKDVSRWSLLPGIQEFVASCDRVTRLDAHGIVLSILHTTDPAIVKHAQRVIKRLEAVLCIFGYQGRRIECVLLPFDRPRRFPRRGKAVTREHINGGFTTIGETKIYVYRKEEWPKVMLHEVLHHMQVNTTTFGSNMSSIQQHQNEAVVEFWAEFLHCKFVSAETGKAFDTLWRAETHHALQQAKRFLEYNPDSHDTAAYGYTVLRCVLVFHWERFIQVDFPYTFKTLAAFFEQGSKDPAFKQALHRTQAWPHPSFRMTIHGDS